ncbi:MAG TPA: hypothetical protein VK982_02465 [Bacteroidales bacterium]|nr:hypothetical protein [Bacteroidales bacterium]
MKLSKTTNKNNDYLQRVLNKLKASRDFIYSGDTIIARKTNLSAGNTFNINDVPYYASEKEYGSDLCQLQTAIRDLEYYINETRKN